MLSHFSFQGVGERIRSVRSGLHHSSFLTYQSMVSFRASPKDFVGFHPSSSRILDESRLYRTSWAGLSSTNSSRASGLFNLPSISFATSTLASSFPVETL